MVTLNRPAARNALSLALQHAIVDVFGALAVDADVAAIVLTGAGQHAFCAGLDLKELAAGVDLVNLAIDPVAAVAAVGKPVIAAINGAAITGGLELMLACDLALCADSAIFVDSHARMNVSPGWGLSQRLSRRIGLPRALEMSLGGRPVDAATACAWGLVNHVAPAAELMAQAEALAQAIAVHDPAFIRHYRGLIEEGRNLPLADALAHEKVRSGQFNRAYTFADSNPISYR
ncbi:enoyl-CoA hydratase-related protein [Novosphingobium resinovorum]|uniref:enoyl-CoA hydratase-related protein n=1 Tax=Novosphingobium resinovorum TaxID=158500 RepID=UPI000AE24032|nr:enoyl-CoA hydratase-related protein [Novosphingobium resinovorum]